MVFPSPVLRTSLFFLKRSRVRGWGGSKKGRVNSRRRREWSGNVVNFVPIFIVITKVVGEGFINIVFAFRIVLIMIWDGIIVAKRVGSSRGGGK